MKRFAPALAAAAVVAMLGAAMPVLAGGSPGAISITSPAAGSIIGASTAIAWTYQTGEAFGADATVIAETKLDGPVWTLIGTAPITDLGMQWDTTSLAEGAGHKLRLTVQGTNRKAQVDGLILDTTPPTIELSVAPASCEAPAWCAADLATVTVVASDATGLAVDPSGDYDVSAEGSEALSFEAVDLAGNSTIADVTVQLDRTAPTLTAVVDPAGCEAPVWCNAEAATITVTASDALAGLDEDPSGAYVITDEGETVLVFQATDNAGNVSTIEVAVRLDRTGPTTSIDSRTLPVVVHALGDAITGTADDELSGVASTMVTFVSATGDIVALDAILTDAGDIQATWAVDSSALSPGLYTVTAASTDMAGNEGPPSTPVEMLIV